MILTIYVIAFENLYSMVIGILSGVFTVGIALLITGTIICVCCHWRRRKKSIKFNRDIEQSSQDTHPLRLTSAITLRDSNSYNEVCNFNI